MDWTTRDRLAAGKAKTTPAPQSRRLRKTQALGLPDSEAIRIPAASGKRVLVSEQRPRTTAKAGPCISYNINDPSRVTIFTPSRESRHARHAKDVREVLAPEVVRYGTVNNIGEDYS